MLFSRTKTLFTFIQLIGAGFLVIVVLTHICEALPLFCFMQWGSPHSPGHYLDLGSAVLGLILFPAGSLVFMLGENVQWVEIAKPNARNRVTAFFRFVNAATNSRRSWPTRVRGFVKTGLRVVSRGIFPARLRY